MISQVIHCTNGLIASSILLIVLTLVHIMHEQATFNLEEMEKLKKGKTKAQIKL